MKIINSISEYHRLLSVPAPTHPLISVVNVADIRFVQSDIWERFAMNFYCISLKKNITGKTRYGREYYDFDKGTMTFVAPMQMLSLEDPHTGLDQPSSGHILFIHPDLLHGHDLSSMDRDFGFFSYAVNEALHLSEKEEKNIIGLFKKIKQEYGQIDQHTQHIILSHIDLLLRYSERFYQRQFITRKVSNHHLIDQMERYLTDHLENQEGLKVGIPTVEALATKLNVSSHYLSDLLRLVTGQNTQQYIQHRLIEKAKEYLNNTQLTVAEIAYTLGFEYPQSFNKLFKKKTNISPLEFRHSQN